MKHIALLAFVLFAQSGYADTFDNCLQVEEEDGSPSNVGCQPLRVPNGSLTDNSSYYSLAITNAATATALAADPANCSAGSTAGGVTAAGVAESCLDPIVSTEIDTSSELDTIVTDNTGSGALVFGTSPDLTTPTLGGATGIRLTGSSGILTIAGIGNTNNENLTLNFESVSNAVGISSGTAVTALTFGNTLIRTQSAGASGGISSDNNLSSNGTAAGAFFRETNANTGASSLAIGVDGNGTASGNSATSTAYGLRGTGLKSGTTGGNTGTIIGVRGIGQYSSTGTQIDAIGVYGTAQKITSASGSITDAYAIFGDLPTASGGGTLTRHWGLGLSDAIGFTSALGTAPDASITRTGAAALSTESTFVSTNTGSIGWSVVAGANTACNTTCTSACVFGFDAGTPTIVDCADATADKCLCAGAN